MWWYFGNSFADPRIDKVPLVTGTEGKMTISQAAAKIDPIAYPKLTAQRVVTGPCGSATFKEMFI